MYKSRFEGKSTEQILEMCNAVVVNDHFVYKKGGHGPAYVNKDVLFLHPEALDYIAGFLAQKAIQTFHCHDVDVVVGPVNGGMLLANLVASHLSHILNKEVLAAYADKEGDGFEIRRGYDKVISDAKVLIVEDIVNSGDSIAKVVLKVLECGGIICGAIGICNRGGATAQDVGLTTEFFTFLMNVKMANYPAQECPLCFDKVPINIQLGHGKDFLKKK